MLPLILTVAAVTAPATPPVLPPDGTYTYVSTMNGTTVGTTAITVSRNSGGIILTEKGGGSFNGESGTIEDTLNLDNTLAPSAYSASASLGERALKSALTFNSGSATETGDAGTKTYDLTAGATHFVILDLGPFSGWFALPAQMAAWNNAPAIAIAPALGHGFPLAPAPAPASQRPKTVPAADASIDVTSPVGFTVWYDPKTLIVDRVEIPTQGFVVTRKA